MSTDIEKKTVTLKTSEGEVFEVEEMVAMEFATVKSYFEENSDAPSDTVVPLPNVSAEPLEKIIIYCKTQLELRAKEASEDEKKTYDVGFLEEQSNEELKEMILVANYLNIKSLLDLLNQAVADRIKNRSVEFVRNFFGVENDYTEEEERQVRDEYAWAFENVEPDD